jgi:hypothetical protein
MFGVMGLRYLEIGNIPRLTNAVNAQWLTYVTRAALLGRIGLMEVLMRRIHIVHWLKGPVKFNNIYYLFQIIRAII